MLIANQTLNCKMWTDVTNATKAVELCTQMFPKRECHQVIYSGSSDPLLRPMEKLLGFWELGPT